MLSILIAAIIALFAFIGSVASDSALPALQDAQDKVVAALSEVDPPSENSSSNSAGEGQQNGIDNNNNGDENSNAVEPDTTKIAAYNTEASFVLPTEITQVAVDSSLALIGCEEDGADCEDPIPGESENGPENSSNGIDGLAKAEEAKSNRP